jgi:hypothetical protein
LALIGEARDLHRRSSETKAMRNSTAVVIALLVSVPFACAHDDRNAESPGGRVPGSAGGEMGPAAPSVTQAPVVPGVPNATGDSPPSSLNPSPGPAMTDSRTTIKPMGIAHLSAGTHATLGTGGTGSGGTLDGVGGTMMGGTGGSAIAH